MYENQSEKCCGVSGVRLETIAVHSEHGDDNISAGKTLSAGLSNGYVNDIRVPRSRDSGFIDTEYASDGHNQYMKPDSAIGVHTLVPIKEPDCDRMNVLTQQTDGRSPTKLADIYTTPRYIDEPLPRRSDMITDIGIGDKLGDGTSAEEENGENYDRLKENEYEKITTYHRNPNVDTMVSDGFCDATKRNDKNSKVRTYTKMDFMRVGNNALESVPNSKRSTNIHEDGCSVSNNSFPGSMLGIAGARQARSGCGIIFVVVIVTFITGVLTGVAGPVSFVVMDRSRSCECTCVAAPLADRQEGIPATTSTVPIDTATTADIITDSSEKTIHTTAVPHQSEVANETTPAAASAIKQTTATVTTTMALTTAQTTTTPTTTTPTTTTTTQPIPTGGAVYTRWGRTTCPVNGTDTIYTGYAAGGGSSVAGGITTPVCLPAAPSWNRYSSTADDDRAFLYGTQYSSEDIFNTLFLGRSLQHEDVPCAVCQASGRPANLLVPGRIDCYPAWQLEYSGYLMAGIHAGNHATQMVCVDGEPETRPGGGADEGGNLLYFVEVRSGSLPAPPYNDRRELACAVCTQ